MAPFMQSIIWAMILCSGSSLGAKTFKVLVLDALRSKPDGNIWCPRQISRKLKPVPGHVTTFLKKPTWWQSHVAG